MLTSHILVIILIAAIASTIRLWLGNNHLCKELTDLEEKYNSNLLSTHTPDISNSIKLAKTILDKYNQLKTEEERLHMHITINVVYVDNDLKFITKVMYSDNTDAFIKTLTFYTPDENSINKPVTIQLLEELVLRSKDVQEVI